MIHYIKIYLPNNIEEIIALIGVLNNFSVVRLAAPLVEVTEDGDWDSLPAPRTQPSAML